MSIKYRLDIDALRAIAVVSVLVFHLGIASVPGGFVGVDIFFVISGYLISKIIFKETADGNFSIIRFYERRARRILPAFLVVSLLTAVVAYFLFFPSELVTFSRSLIAATLFSENIFLFFNSGYFAPTAERLPLLHYWTLGVEEQFYILFPILLILVRKFFPRTLTAWVVVSLLASLFASGFLTHQHLDLTFYLLPFRAFELLIGSFLALPIVSIPRDATTAWCASFLGLCAIAISIVFFTKDMDFPGFAAALPCVGSALMIWGGSGVPTSISRLLGRQPFQFIGKISYSLYLVHWPVIVFGIQLLPTLSMSKRVPILLTVSVALAVLSFFFVEQPFRTNPFWTRSRIFKMAVVSIVLPAGIAAVTVYEGGYPERFNGRVNYILSFLQYNPAKPFREGQCFLKPDETQGNFDQTLCFPPKAGKQVVLWGDSTAADQYSGLVDQLNSRGYSLSQATASACAPIVGYDAPDRPNCKGFNDFIFSKIIADKPDVLVLASSWTLDESSTNLLKKMLEKLKASNINTVIIGPAPYYQAAVPRIIADRLLSRNHSTTSDGTMLPTIQTIDKKMFELSKEMNIDYISILQILCKDNNCPLLTESGDPIEFDVLHFTTSGSSLLGTMTVPLIVGADTRNNLSGH